VTLPAGRSRLRFSNVASRVENSVQLAVPNARVLSHSSLGADNDARTVLRKSIGQRVTLRYHDMAPITGTLRQVEPFVAVETTEGTVIERAQSLLISVERLPADLISRPILEALVESNGAGGNAELRYLTTGLGWSASYRATLAGDRLSLAAWATVSNSTNADFRNARVNLVETPTQNSPMFAVPGTIHLPASSSREFLLASFDNAAFTQDIVWSTDSFNASVSGNPRLTLTLKENAPQELPAGALTVYGMGQNGSPVLLNNSTLGALNQGENIRLALGEVPFLIISRGIASQRRLNPKTNEFVIGISLQNAGTAPVTVRIVEPIPTDVKVTASTQPPSKSQSRNLEFLVTVPAKDNVRLQYTVERPI
jgi:hypothetical protein